MWNHDVRSNLPAEGSPDELANRHLVETHAGFCQAGQANNEYCLWLTTPPCSEALATFRIPRPLRGYCALSCLGQLEFVPYASWY